MIKPQLLLKYQQEIFQDQSRFIVIEKSRRVGISWLLSAKAIYERFAVKRDCWFVSANLDTAKEFVRYCKEWADVYNAMLGQEVIDLRLSTTETMVMPNGSRIGVLSSNPVALRGLSGDVILDEFAFHEDQDALLTAAQPVTTWAEGKLIICSTHNGASSTFYRICQGAISKTNPYKHYKIDLHRALEDGFAIKVKGDHHKMLPDVKACNKAFYDYLKSTCVSEDAFRQEFLAEPMSLSALISGEEYDRLTLFGDVPDHLDHTQNYRDLFVGIDVGRTHDLTVVWVIEQYQNPEAKEEHERYDYKTVCVKAIRNTDIPTQFQMIKQIISHHSIQKVVIDMGAVGRALSDALVDEMPNIVEPFSFTASRKAALCERVKGYVQAQRVSLPTDPVIRDDILSMKRIATKAGNLSYDGRTANTHCDYFLSLSMSLEAAVTSNQTYVVGLR